MFFTFTEGQFAFDCARCTVPCCREAGGLWFGRGQSDALDQLGATPFVTSIGRDHIQVEFGRGGCPALRPDGLCQLHATGGRRAKPALCALFPFSRLYNLGAFLVVAPNVAFCCPLMVDPEPGTGVVRHSEILADLEYFFGGGRSVFSLVTLPQHGAVTLAGEIAFRDGIRRVRDEKRGLLTALAEIGGVPRARLAREVDAALSLFELNWPAAPRRADDRLLALLPTLRPLFYQLPGPAIVRALALGERLLARFAEQSKQPLTVRQLATTFTSHESLLRLLARCQQPVALGTKTRLPAVGDPEVVLETRAIIRAIERHPHERTIHELVTQHSRLAGEQRALLLRALAQIDFVFEQPLVRTSSRGQGS